MIRRYLPVASKVSETESPSLTLFATNRKCPFLPKKCTLHASQLLFSIVFNYPNIAQYRALYLKRQLQLYTFAPLVLRAAFARISCGSALLSIVLGSRRLVQQGNLWSWSKIVPVCSRTYHVTRTLSMTYVSFKPNISYVTCSSLRFIRPIYGKSAIPKSIFTLRLSPMPTLCYYAKILNSTSWMDHKRSISLTSLFIAFLLSLLREQNVSGSIPLHMHSSYVSSVPALSFVSIGDLILSSSALEPSWQAFDLSPSRQTALLWVLLDTDRVQQYSLIFAELITCFDTLRRPRCPSRMLLIFSSIFEKAWPCYGNMAGSCISSRQPFLSGFSFFSLTALWFAAYLRQLGIDF